MSGKPARTSFQFVIVLPGADLERAMRDADQLRESVMTIDSRRWLKDRRITVSIGVTVSKTQGDTLSTMLQRADAALYDAKRNGRDLVCVAPESYNSASTGIRRALKDSGIAISTGTFERIPGGLNRRS